MKNWIRAAVLVSMGGAVSTAWASRALACNVDGDCNCGQVCSWAVSPHACTDASGGDPGWCDGTPDCLYQGQTCQGTSCMPAWTSNSVCLKGGGSTSTGGTSSGGGPTSTGSGTAGATASGGGATASGGNGAGTTGGTHAGSTGGATGGATGGTTTSSTAGTTSSSGGCSTTGGSFALAVLLGLGLLGRRRKSA